MEGAIRLLRRSRAMFPAGLAVLSLGACGSTSPAPSHESSRTSSSTAERPTSVSPASIRRAAAATTRGGGYRVATQSEITIGSDHTTESAAGSISEPSGAGMMTLLGKSVRTVVFAGGKVFQRIPRRTLAPGKIWAEVNQDASLQMTFGSPPFQSDPALILEMLRTTTQATRQGAATVRGVPTTHYHVMVDLARYARQLSLTKSTLKVLEKWRAHVSSRSRSG